MTILTDLSYSANFLASSGGELLLNYSDLTARGVAWQVFLLFLFIFINGFFVAAEFALVKVRASQLEVPVEEGSGAAKLAQHILSKLDAYLSACQLGITIASIVLGSVSEPFISMLLQPLLSRMGVPEAGIHTISFLFGVSAITFLHVVVGEQMPKVLAIRKALGTSMICSRPLHWFYLIFKWPIRILNICASFLLRWIFKMEPVEDGHDAVHSSEELRILVEETGKAQEVTETEQEILINALELSELTVRDIITPRNDVVALDVNRTFDENLQIALESKHTRFPLVDGHLDKTLGLIHIKDLIGEMRTEKPDMLEVRRDLMPVPELIKLDDMLKLFRSKKAHMALVVDEYGGSLGLVMLDDVLDQVVGDIQDEFDEDNNAFKFISDDEFVVEGAFPLHELDDRVLDLDLESPDVSTVGGYITSIVGKLPEAGHEMDLEGYRVEITEADDRSVREVRFTRLPASQGDEKEEVSEAGNTEV